MDKIDQQLRMNYLSFTYFAMPSVYLYHMDEDADATAVLGTALRIDMREESTAPTRIARPHMGRHFCASIGTGETPTRTFLGWLREHQMNMCWTRWWRKREAAVEEDDIFQPGHDTRGQSRITFLQTAYYGDAAEVIHDQGGPLWLRAGEGCVDAVYRDAAEG